MLSTRLEQENVIHRQQSAAAGKAQAPPKTPARQTYKTPHKTRLGNENAASVRQLEGKVKDAVAVLENKVAKHGAEAAISRQARVPLGAKTVNNKGTAFQTPAPALTRQRPIPQQTSPRLRRARFQVHEAEPELITNEDEPREIEYMHPRCEPLPDYPDEDIWPHDRVYPQLKGENFSRGWALEVFQDDNECDFDTRMRQFEAADAKKTTVKKVVATSSAKITSTRAASGISSVRGIGRFASATTSSAARAVLNSKTAARNAPQSNTRHAIAKGASRTTLGYTRGREVAAQAPRMIQHDLSPVTYADRAAVLHGMWRKTEDTDVGSTAAPIDFLDLEELRGLDFDLPDD